MSQVQFGQEHLSPSATLECDNDWQDEHYPREVVQHRTTQSEVPHPAYRVWYWPHKGDERCTVPDQHGQHHQKPNVEGKRVVESKHGENVGYVVFCAFKVKKKKKSGTGPDDWYLWLRQLRNVILCYGKELLERA